MKKIYLLGLPNSGKTYQAISMAKSWGKFVFAAPCRQLVYETSIKYGNLNDSVITGEVQITPENNLNLFCVYESLYKRDLTNYDTLIIDECHFMRDPERGEALKGFVNNWHGNIILLTGTPNFQLSEDWETIVLESLVKPQIKIYFNDGGLNHFYEETKEQKLSSIYFSKYDPLRYWDHSEGDWSLYEPLYDKMDGTKAGHLSRSVESAERLKIQLGFMRGDISYLEVTNIAAQGINLPTRVVLIEYNEHDTDEVIRQKIGRLGRFGTDAAGQQCYLIFIGFYNKVEKNKWKKYVNGLNQGETEETFLTKLKKKKELKFPQEFVLPDFMKNEDNASFHDEELEEIIKKEWCENNA